MIKIVCFFNNYGFGLKIIDKRVIFDFVCDILVGKDIVMFFDGFFIRIFCYVVDVIIGYYKILIKGK